MKPFLCFKAFAFLCALVLISSVRAYDYNGTPAGHLIHRHTTAEIKQKILEGWRPTGISTELNVSGIGFYRVVYVQNTGTHYQEVRFEGEITGATVNSIRDSGWRIEDIEVIGSKFAGIFIRNNVNVKNTTWFAGWTAEAIQTWLGTNTAFRLLEIDRYGVSGNEKFSGVFIRNTGNGYVPGWGWFTDATSTTIGNWATTNKMRVVDFDQGLTGRYAAVLVNRPAGQRYYYYGGRSISRVLEIIGGLGLRVVTINQRTQSGSTTFSITAVNNTNNQSARMADMTWKLHNGVQGFYVKQMGNFNPVVDLNGTRAMHPSSTIKALIHYTGARDTSIANLDTRTINGTLMRTLHQNMMYNSDNPSSNLLMDTYTINRLHTVAHSQIGMSQTTQMRNRFGTGGPYGNDQITETTLSDLALLHTAIRDGRLGFTKTTWLRDNMNNETRSFPWNSVVSNVRSSIGISNTNYNDWVSRVRSLNKAGNNGSNGINGYWSVAGSLTLPYKSSTTVNLRVYLFGHYVNGSTISYEGSTPWNIVGELLREQIRASMLTFK